MHKYAGARYSAGPSVAAGFNQVAGKLLQPYPSPPTQSISYRCLALVSQPGSRKYWYPLVPEAYNMSARLQRAHARQHCQIPIDGIQLHASTGKPGRAH